MKLSMLQVFLPLALSAPAPGAEKKSITLPQDNAMAELKQGPGADVARANCGGCHSTDYIVRQRPDDPKQWESEVRKMMTVFGAPISEPDARIIVDYLASAYGPQTKATPADRPSHKQGGKREGAKKAADDRRAARDLISETGGWPNRHFQASMHPRKSTRTTR